MLMNIHFHKKETTDISRNTVSYHKATIEKQKDFTAEEIPTRGAQRIPSSATQQNSPLDQYIPQLIENQSAITPDAWAIVEGDYALSYGDLNRRTNQLAHYLHTQGIKPGTLVGLYRERSVDMIVGLLGILKAGAAYVPLDPAYPSARLNFMLEDAHISLLVTSQTLA